MVGHTFDPSTLEAVAGRFCEFKDSLLYIIEFQVSQGYTVRSCLQKRKKVTLQKNYLITKKYTKKGTQGL